MADPGRVSLVGAGPGDPGLLTVAAVDRLRRADIVLYDYLANAALLGHARPDAVRLCLGRHGDGKLWSQPEINARLVREALDGRSVVRLKGGDPGVFGRLAEEVAACREAGVPFEVLPGVTTAIAAGAYAGLPLTDRDRASCLTLVTGHEREGKTAELAIDFEALAAVPGTLVIYMGVTTAPTWSRRLIAGGKPADTPVRLVRRCSLPDQTIIDCTLGELPEVLAPKRTRPPLVAIVGEVARGADHAAWFTSRPLFGQTVLLTRPEGSSTVLADRLAELGASVLEQPAIEIAPAPDMAELDDTLNRLSSFAWVVFSSRNGVNAVMDRLATQGRDARAFGGCRLAVVGTATADALANHGLRADLTPDKQSAEGLIAKLGGRVAGDRVLLVRASRGRDTLAAGLTAAGAEVEQVVAYASRDVATADASILAEVAAGRVDWVAVTSSAIARSTARLLGDAIDQAPRPPRFVAISPLTADALRDAGHEAAAVAEHASAEGIVAAIRRAVGKA